MQKWFRVPQAHAHQSNDNQLVDYAKIDFSAISS